VDAVGIDRFESYERDNLYVLWNRMSSGSYFPGPVRAVEIPKDHGAGIRGLGERATSGHLDDLRSWVTEAMNRDSAAAFGLRWTFEPVVGLGHRI
jgi:hypothetical protein